MLAHSHDSADSQLDTCLAKLNLHEFLGRVIPGFSTPGGNQSHLAHDALLAVSGCTCSCGSTTSQLEKIMEGATVTKDMIKQHLE